MDYLEKVKILQSVFKQHKDAKQKEQMKKTYEKMTLIHGQLVEQMINVTKSAQENRYKLLSELDIVNSQIKEIIQNVGNDITNDDNELHRSVIKKLNKNIPTLILFFADWCKPCQLFLPEWDKLEKKLENHSSELNTIKYSCVTYSEECNKISEITSFPTMLLYTPSNKKLTKFENTRNIDNIIEFVNKNIKTNIKP